VLAASVGTVNVTGSGSVRCELIGAPSRDYDVVVIATGRWSSDVLRASRLEEGELRTKVIECGLWETGDWRPPPFVDGISGLYGTPLDANVMLLGLPTDRWDVDPDWPPDSSESPLQVMTSALRRFPRLRLGPIRRWVTSADSYGRAGTLALDPVIGTEGTVFTFAGGSGGSIKTALAASHRAAAQIAGPWSELDTVPASPRTPEGIRT
jgi:glycine/D-amino acid oxidase-like deaminating enzyme